jgi:hypothetical protein
LLTKGKRISQLNFITKSAMPQMIKKELRLLFVLVKSVFSKTYPASPTSFKQFKVFSRIQTIKLDQLRQLPLVEFLSETPLSS